MPSTVFGALEMRHNAIIGAMIQLSNPDDFCRELSLNSLQDKNAGSVWIVELTQNSELQIIGRYGASKTSEDLEFLNVEVESAIREKNVSSHRVIEMKNSNGELISASIFPNGPRGLAASAVLIFYKNNGVPAFEIETEVALSFACEIYCSQNWGSVLNSRKRRISGAISSSRGLTERQLDVLSLLSLGKKNIAIARALNYSVATVKNEISTIFQYLGVDNRQDVIVEAEKVGLLPPPPKTSEN
jgi:DNA-binding CsgD family transcriptional regulator